MLAAELGHEGRRFCARSLSRSPATSVRLRWGAALRFDSKNASSPSRRIPPTTRCRSPAHCEGFSALSREGVDLDVSTLADWVDAAAGATQPGDMGTR